jgi:glycosyltransferase involved in cell wall biosynthesis
MGRAGTGIASGEDLVSVVIPAYNAGHFIRKTLASALAQTHPHFEVLLVDDGSTDATPEIVASVAQREPRLRLIRQQNGGVAAARNRGIEEARGEFIAVLDADDLWHPDKLRLQAACLREAGPDTALVYCWACIIDDEERVLFPEARPRLIQRRAVFRKLLRHTFFCASAPLMRASALREVGGYNPSLRARGGEGCEDKDLYLRIAERYDFGVVPAVLVAYRFTLGSMSNNALQMKRSNDLILSDTRARHPGLPESWFVRGACRADLGAVAKLLRAGRHQEAMKLLLGVIRQHPLEGGREILSLRGLSFLYRRTMRGPLRTWKVTKLDWPTQIGDRPIGGCSREHALQELRLVD